MMLTSHHDTIACRVHSAPVASAAAAAAPPRAAPPDTPSTHGRGRRPPTSANGSAAARPTPTSSELKRVGVGHRPHAAGHRVERDHRRRDQDAGRQVRCRGRRRRSTPSATSSSALQNISASIAGSDSTTAHRAPKRASNGSISVCELVRAHAAREEQAAEDQADAEADAALQAAGEARPVDALGGAEQVAAVHPGRRHGEGGEPQRHRPAGDHEVGGASRRRLAARRPASRCRETTRTSGRW